MRVFVCCIGLLQTAAIATFGGGACRSPYWAVSNPRIITPLLGQPEQWTIDPVTYLGWCYWMALTGNILTVVAGVLFAVAAFSIARNTGKFG